MTEIERLPFKMEAEAEVMPRIVIEVREVKGTGAQAGWRVFQERAKKYGRLALTDQGRLLGGTFEQAVQDAQRIADENGFLFQRPDGLILPPGS